MQDIEVELSLETNILKKINKKIEMFVGVKIKKNKNKYIIPKELFEGKEIEDEIRYKLEVANKKIIAIEYIRNNITNNIIEDEKCEKIVIILESPHKDEYTFDYTPIGPAQGKTGRGIDNHLEKIIELLNVKDGTYAIIISNPVRVQASLGTFTNGKMITTLRNNIWTALYNKAKYKTTLEKYKPKYILNATTEGRMNRINELVDELEGVEEKKTTNHPSVWDNKKIKER